MIFSLHTHVVLPFFHFFFRVCHFNLAVQFLLVQIQLHEIPLVDDKVSNPGDTVLYLYVKPTLRIIFKWIVYN